MAYLDQIQSAGSMGLTSRPKARSIDKILMKQRDDKAQEAHEAQSAMMPNGAAVMGAGPGTNLFGGPGAFNRPDTLAMMLGSGGR